MASFEPNILNEYETYVPKLKLYMVPPESVDMLDVNIQNGNNVLMASNAEDARYSISRAETHFIVGTSKVSSGMNSRVELTIEEPNGVTFLPKILEAAKTLRIKSHLQATYLLEIRFMCRQHNGNAVEHKTPFFIPVIVSGFNTQIEGQGARYNITMVEQNVMGYHKQVYVLKKTLRVRAETVKEFLSEFTKSLNISNENDIKFNDEVVYVENTFDFQLADNIREEWGKWKLEETTGKARKGGINITKTGGKLEFILPAGSRYDAIIEAVLRTTNEYKRVPTTESRKFIKEKADESRAQHKLVDIPVFFKILPEVTYGKYDALQGKYQKDVTYTIYKYAMPDQPIDRQTYIEAYFDDASQKSRIRKLVDERYIQKRYDYLYTGKNTEVIRLELNLDLLYYYATPIGGGASGASHSLYTPAATGDPGSTISRIRNLRQGIVNINKQLQTTHPFAASELIEQRENLQRELDQTSNTSNDNFSYIVPASADAIPAASQYGPDQTPDRSGFFIGTILMNKDTVSDMLIIEMQIRGDPYWLGLPKTVKSINEFQNSRNGLANLLKDSIFFWLNVHLPLADEDADGLRIPKANYQISGLYRVIDIFSVFEQGQFIQTVKAVYDVNTNIAKVYNDINSDRPLDTTPPNVTVAETTSAAQQQEDARV